MELIDKAALVAEIKKRLKHNGARAELDRSAYMAGREKEDEDILTLIDTFKVTEVNLEKEYEEFVVDDPILGNFITNDTMGMKLAKHFFELGLKAKGE